MIYNKKEKIKQPKFTELQSDAPFLITRLQDFWLYLEVVLSRLIQYHSVPHFDACISKRKNLNLAHLPRYELK